MVVGPTSAATFTVPARAGHDHLVEWLASPTTLPYAPVNGVRATTFRQLGNVTIGLPPSAAQIG